MRGLQRTSAQTKHIGRILPSWISTHDLAAIRVYQDAADVRGLDSDTRARYGTCRSRAVTIAHWKLTSSRSEGCENCSIRPHVNLAETALRSANVVLRSRRTAGSIISQHRSREVVLSPRRRVVPR